MIEAVARAERRHGREGRIDRRPVMVHAQTRARGSAGPDAGARDHSVVLRRRTASTGATGTWPRCWAASGPSASTRRGRRGRAGYASALHNDAPVVPPNILFLIWSAVTRLSRSGAVIGPEQRLTPSEALRAVTIDAAYQHFEDERKGSLEVGKLADMAVLSENPLRVRARGDQGDRGSGDLERGDADPRPRAGAGCPTRWPRPPATSPSAHRTPDARQATGDGEDRPENRQLVRARPRVAARVGGTMTKAVP